MRDDGTARQESLRTIFPESGDGGLQQVLPMDQVELGVEVETIAEGELQSALAAFASRGFDANVSAMSAVKDMIQKSIDLLK